MVQLLASQIYLADSQHCGVTQMAPLLINLAYFPTLNPTACTELSGSSTEPMAKHHQELFPATPNTADIPDL